MATPKGFSDFKVDPNGVYYFDTNMLIANFAPHIMDSPDVALAQHITRALIAAQSYIVTSSVSGDEVYSALTGALRSELVKCHGYSRKQAIFKNVKKLHPQAFMNVAADRDSILESFDMLPGIIVDYLCCRDNILLESNVIRLTGLGNFDAKHLAAAEMAGADYFVTADQDFAGITANDITVLLPDKYASAPTKVVNFTLTSDDA